MGEGKWKSVVLSGLTNTLFRVVTWVHSATESKRIRLLRDGRYTLPNLRSVSRPSPCRNGCTSPYAIHQHRASLFYTHKQRFDVNTRTILDGTTNSLLNVYVLLFLGPKFIRGKNKSSYILCKKLRYFSVKVCMITFIKILCVLLKKKYYEFLMFSSERI